MGFNSRNPFLKNLKDHSDWIEYYVTRLKLFFKKLNLSKFTLVAHSIGAYIATHYFDRYHKNVNKLILLSPAGFNMSSELQ